MSSNNKKNLKLFLRSFKLIKPYKVKFTFAILCIIIEVILNLVQPLLWGVLIARLFTRNSNSIIILLLILLLLFLSQSIFSFLQSYLFSYLNENVINDLKNTIFKRIMNLSIAVFDKLGVGTLISRLHEDTSVIANIITNQLINTLIDIIKIIVIGIVVFAINPILALLTIMMFPINYIINIKSKNRLKENSIQIRKYYDFYFSNIQESFLGIKEIRCLGAKETKIKSFSKLSLQLKILNIKKSILIGIVSNLSMTMNYFSQIIIYSVGAYLTFKGVLKIEYFIAFTAYSQQLSSSLTNITTMNAKVQQALISLERIFTLIDELSFSTESFGDLLVDTIYGNIKFVNVKFAYDDTKQILNGITFDLTCNKKYMIVGASGSGKSTIFNLLLRFYNINSGEIIIDNININELNESSLRKHISIVRQDTVLFGTSIKENLLLANPDSTDLEIENACRIANIHDFIISLENGYNSSVCENGSNFSGGERQRFAIARAILKKSKIILFDEATSSLDSESQFKIKNSINLLSNDHTIILITHKLTDIIDADEILIIENGKISGKGTHEYLISNNKEYRRLYGNEIEILSNYSMG